MRKDSMLSPCLIPPPCLVENLLTLLTTRPPWFSSHLIETYRSFLLVSVLIQFILQLCIEEIIFFFWLNLWLGYRLLEKLPIMSSHPTKCSITWAWQNYIIPEPTIINWASFHVNMNKIETVSFLLVLQYNDSQQIVNNYQFEQASV